MSERYVHIFCGTGTGKTAAATGRGLREASMGKSVFLIQFLKEKQSDEGKEFFDRLEPEMKQYRFEKFPENYESLSPKEKEDETRNIRNGLNFAKKVLLTDECDVLILDEILGLVGQGIVTVDEIRALIETASNTTIYLTGTERCEELWPYADEVTELTTQYRRNG